MAFKTPINPPLTDSQNELTSKIGAMKSLLSLPSLKKRNIPKDKQISTFDYLMKILTSLGINPEIAFQLFVNKVFDVTTNFLEDKVIDAVGASLDAKGIKLSSSQSNADVIRTHIPSAFIGTLKLAIAKELTLMIFGPKDGSAAEKLVPDPSRRAFLIGEAICGYNMFSLSNNPSIRNEDVEFNRIKLKQQLERGQPIIEINCQDVKISLPEDPGYIFGEGGPNTISSSPITPAQSIIVLNAYVVNRTQQINNQQNSNRVGQSFFQILLTRLLSYITTLVIPYVGPIFSFLNTQTDINGTNLAGLTPENTLYGSCSIAGDSSNNQKKAFSKNIMNALLKELLKGMLLLALNEFKKLVANYFARTALERLRRKAEKIKMKFKIFNNTPDIGKAARSKQALSQLKNVLGDDANG